MNTLKIEFTNCYGIRELKEDLIFENTDNGRAVAIYAPNGSMKTSLAKTFDQLKQGFEPKDERYHRQSSWVLETDGRAVESKQIIDKNGVMSSIKMGSCHYLCGQAEIVADRPCQEGG